MSEPLPLARIVRIVAQRNGVTPEAVLGQSRYREEATARQEAYWLASKLPGYTTPRIGRFMNRDHSTVMHGRDVIEERVRADGEYADGLTRALATVLTEIGALSRGPSTGRDPLAIARGILAGPAGDTPLVPRDVRTLARAVISQAHSLSDTDDGGAP